MAIWRFARTGNKSGFPLRAEIIRPLAKLYNDKISYNETGERNMNTNTNNGNPADEIWAILKNVARRQKELARRQKETDRQMK